MERVDQLPDTSLENHVLLIEEKKKLKEEIRSRDDTIEKMKQADTAIIVYESKFQELKEKDEKKDSMLRAERDKNQE